MSNAPAGFDPRAQESRWRPGASSRRSVHMIGNAHLDPVWLWPWQEGYQEARATFWSAIHRMDEYPDFIFTCDQIVLLSWVEESDPELFDRITQRVKEGRWVNVGGWWVEPDCNMPSGESFARQGLYGQRFLRSRFGIPATVGMNADPFGHNAMLPQILRLQGIDSYCFLRPGAHETAMADTAFWWESPDGSRVLAYRIPFEYGSSAGGLAFQTEKAIAQADHALSQIMVFYGVGNHGGGPTKANIESIYRFDRMGTYGQVTMSSPRHYFDELARHRGPGGMAQLPVWRDDLQHHAPGCYSAHSGIKQWQRKAQAALLRAERWAAVAAVRDGIRYPRADLERAWKQVLFNQFHDVLPGSAIESAYDDARDQLGEAIAICKRIITQAHNVIARQVNVPLDVDTQPVLVFNPHPWPITTEVELQYNARALSVHVLDAEGRQTPSQRIQTQATMSDTGRGAIAFEVELPAFGYRLYRLHNGDTPATTPFSGEGLGTLKASENVLENEFLRVQLDPRTGWLCSLLDKRTGVDLLAGALGEHTHICQDPTDTWGHGVVSYNWPGDAMHTDRIVLRESGPVRARLRVERSWGRSTLTEEFILGHRSNRVEVRVTLDWREQAHLLKLRFPVALENPIGTYEIPYGTIERPLDGAEQPGQSWVDVTGAVPGGGSRRAGLAVLNDAKHGYDVSPAGDSGGQAVSPSIGITAVRSPVYAWHDPRQLDPDGFYSYQDQGVQHFRYLLVPHDGDWRGAELTRGAAVLGAPPRAMLESFHTGTMPPQHSFVDDGAGQVMITAIKGSEDPGSSDLSSSDLIVRAVETLGRPAKAHLDIPLIGRTIEADFGAYQVRTFRVPYAAAEPIVEVDLIEWPLDTTEPA
ncbi:alpha-mannosidase [Parafrigoribacterium mesophilum]|uniref:alpha-mannosidase n=1 Tax=Parafrigoribacterium mesophilum TaxID=433646 RepID=UPI0031FBF507